MQDTWVWSLGWEGLMEKEMATHSSILAWEIPWTEELGRLYTPRGRQRVWQWLNNKWKKSIWEGDILVGLLTVWGSRRGKNYVDSKKSVVAKDNQGSENKYIEHKGPLGQYTILFDTIVVYPGHYTFVETYRTYNTKNEP